MKNKNNSKENNEMKLRPKIGCLGTMLLLPALLFLLGIVLLVLIASKEPWSKLFVVIALFFTLRLFLHFVLYFAETYFYTFFVFEGKKKIPYDKIVKISGKNVSDGGIPHPIKVYFLKKNKVKLAVFDVSSWEYVAEVLTFLKDKVPEGVIDEYLFKKQT